MSSRRRASAGIVALIVAGLVAAPASAAPPVGSSGSGTYALLGTTPTAFDYAAIALPNGRAAGELFVSTVLQGFAVEFEGDLDIPTSAAYCALQPWAPDDARTWEVTAGNIQVHD